MNRKSAFIKLGSSALILLGLTACSTIQAGREEAVLENEVLTKTFSFSSRQPDRISVEVADRAKGKSLSHSAKVPLFEFVLNNRLISSNDKLWVFRDRQTRAMQNGGTEHTLVFEGRAAGVQGLLVVITEQIFPDSTLMREKLTLKSEGPVFRLNKLNGRLHFRFPAYSVENENNRPLECTEIRIGTWEKTPTTFGEKPKGNHMFYPDVIRAELTSAGLVSKGPFSIISNGETSWLTAYEHASQDRAAWMRKKRGKQKTDTRVTDAQQGIEGKTDFIEEDEDLLFLGVSSRAGAEDYTVAVGMFRGGYTDGEVIDPGHPYSTVWTATGFYRGGELEDGKAMIRSYLLHQICEKPASRVPEFYYNTWGMQRYYGGDKLREVMTYERIFKEIDAAAELGVDIFVLDDGWQNKFGEWFANKERLTEGLAPIKERLDAHGIKLGLWLSPMGVDKTSQRYKDHPDWVVRDSDGVPIRAQWGHPAFDFVSGFSDLFVEDCKKLIDQGCRFMKWDAINTFYSDLPNLDHGSDAVPAAERRARFEYLLPVYVTRAIEILTDYEPDLVIEVDLTESRRVMVGLAPLSQGKLFWMNNGASGYGDYSTYRTQSMRTIANEFAGLIPLELFTYANYPQNVEGAMKYNVANSLLAGHGFWGNLQLMTPEERQWVGEQVALSKKVLPFLVDVNPQVIGRVGDSPEIYSVVNREEAAGQIIVFSEEPFSRVFSTPVNAEKLLTVLNRPFSVENGSLQVPFQSSERESSFITFLMPNNNSGIRMLSSTSPVTDVQQKNKRLEYRVSAPGRQVVVWNKKQGIPVLNDSNNIGMTVSEHSDFYRLEIIVKKADTPVVIEGSGGSCT